MRSERTFTPHSDWSAVSAASLPAEGLAALAAVRNDGNVRVCVQDSSVWTRWPAGRADVVRCLLPVPGVVFYVQRGEHWFRFGSRLPGAGPPVSEERPLSSVLFPARIEARPPGHTPGPPIPIRVVLGGPPRPTTALSCSIASLAAWADRATTREISLVRAARSAGQAVLRGPSLPTIAGANRYWGEKLLVPIGHRPDPNLPAASLRAAIGASEEELVLLKPDAAVVIPLAAFEPLTRAGIRLALRDDPSGEGRL